MPRSRRKWNILSISHRTGRRFKPVARQIHEKHSRASRKMSVGNIHSFEESSAIPNILDLIIQDPLGHDRSRFVICKSSFYWLNESVRVMPINVEYGSTFEAATMAEITEIERNLKALKLNIEKNGLEKTFFFRAEALVHFIRLCCTFWGRSLRLRLVSFPSTLSRTSVGEIPSTLTPSIQSLCQCLVAYVWHYVTNSHCACTEKFSTRRRSRRFRDWLDLETLSKRRSNQNQK